MPVISVRISDQDLHDRLKREARNNDLAISTLAERLIDEGLRVAAHPAITFRSGPTGRRACLVGGPEVADIVTSIVGGDVPVSQRRSRAARLLEVPESHIDAAMAYYAAYQLEIDEQIASRCAMADELETGWKRQQELLAG